MDTDPSGSGGWRFAQCFGDKGEVEDITEGITHRPSRALSSFHWYNPTLCSGYYLDGWVRLNGQLSGDRGQGWPSRSLRAQWVGTHPTYFSAPSQLMVAVITKFSVDLSILLIMHRIEKRLRVQILHRVSIPWTRVRLSQIIGNRREDQQDKMVQTTERRPFLAVDERSVWFQFRRRDVPKHPH